MSKDRTKSQPVQKEFIYCKIATVLAGSYGITYIASLKQPSGDNPQVVALYIKQIDRAQECRNAPKLCAKEYLMHRRLECGGGMGSGCKRGINGRARAPLVL